MRPLNKSLRKELESLTSQYQEGLSSALPYLQARGIDQDSAEKFRLGVVNDSSFNNGRLAIPSLLPDGGVYSIRFRRLGEDGPKYRGMAGVQTRLFNVRAVHEAGDEIHVTEGELDAVILDSLGYNAVAVCGSESWKRHHPRMLAGFQRVYVWGDGDDAGKKFSATVRDSLLTAKECKLDAGADVTDTFMAYGHEGIKKAMGEDG